MKYIIRILRQVQVLESVKDHEVDAVNLDSAVRQAQIILAQEFAGEPDVIAETVLKTDEDPTPKEWKQTNKEKESEF